MKLIALLLVLSLTACAPEPTAPSDESLAGTWNSTVHVFTISTMRMQLVQEPQGIVSGQWFIRADDAAERSGSIIGRNSVAQAEIQFLGLGQFEGAHVETNTLRGVFAIGEHFENISFVRGTAAAQ